MNTPLNLFAALALAATAVAGEKPNILVIMADDLGYGDVSCNGTSAVKTPNIDRVAAEGLRFTSGYCSASTCTPTRYSLLTGTYAFRVQGTGIAAPNAAALIKPGTPTVASLLKQQGYTTAVIGKWHLGLGEGQPDWNGDLKPGPLEIGFDHCLLLPTTNDRVPQVFVADHRVRNLDPADPLWVGDKQPSPDHPTGISHRAELKMDWNNGHNGTIHNGIDLGLAHAGEAAEAVGIASGGQGHGVNGRLGVPGLAPEAHGPDLVGLVAPDRFAERSQTGLADVEDEFAHP
jgi:arylsulfatase A